jgi:hypothetical protein
MPFPETGAHVISSYIRSKDWQSVQNETDKFFSEIVKIESSSVNALIP